MSKIFVTGGSSLLITINSMTDELTTAFGFLNSKVILSEGKLVANENELHNFTFLLIAIETTIVMENSSFLSITRNRMYSDSVFAYAIWSTSSDSQFTLTNNFVLAGFSFSQ